MMKSDRPFLFHETQYFRQLWLWVIVLVPTLFVLGVLIYSIATGEVLEEEPESVPIVAATLLIMVLVIVGFARVGLTTTIDEEGMSYGWNLFRLKPTKVPWSEVKSLSLIRYKFVGYGIRLSWSYGTVHNVSGNVGLLIERTRGKKFMVGTSKPEEMDQAMRRVVEGQPHIEYVNALSSEEAR